MLRGPPDHTIHPHPINEARKTIGFELNRTRNASSLPTYPGALCRFTVFLYQHCQNEILVFKVGELDTPSALCGTCLFPLVTARVEIGGSCMKRDANDCMKATGADKQ